MQITQPAPSAAPVPGIPAWRDLALYLLAGGGGFVLASLAAGLFLRDASLLASIATYALNILFFGGSVLAVGAARGKLDLRALGFWPPRLTTRRLMGAIILSLWLLPARGLIGIFVQWALTGTLNGIQQRMDLIAPGSFSWAAFAVTLLGAGVLVPIAEELFFRGALFSWFRARFNYPVALVISSLLFALGHIDTAGVVAASFVLGVANAWALQRTRTLWVPIVMHITTNSFAVVVLYASLATGAAR